VKQHWLERPATIRGLWIAGLVALALAVVAGALIEKHPKFGIDGIFGFYAWYGFASGVALVVIAKVAGVLIRRREDYYDGS
jgi:hypothetical protein